MGIQSSVFFFWGEKEDEGFCARKNTMCWGHFWGKQPLNEPGKKLSGGKFERRTSEAFWETGSEEKKDRFKENKDLNSFRTNVK